MKLTSLYIENGDQVLVNRQFTDRLNIIETADTDAVADVVRRLIGVSEKSLINDIVAFATVQTDEVYTIEARRYSWWDDDEDMELIVRDRIARCDGGSNCTAEYLASIRQSAEEDDLVCFADFAREGYPHRLRSYLFTDRGDRNAAIGETTDGFGITRSFRQYWREYVRDFVPVRLRKDEPYVLRLTQDGRFIVTYEQTNEEVCLSETENLLYHLRCFYCLVEFWSGAQRLRRIDPIDKPLLVGGLVERLDEALDRQPFLDIMEACERQTILLVPKTVRGV